MGKPSAKIRKPARKHEKGKYPLDTVSEKPRRGRPGKIKPSWVRRKADGYRAILDKVWDRVGPRLLQAQTRQDVARSFEGTDIGPYSLEFLRLLDLMLAVLKERKFPKRSRKAQVNFLGDSIAGQGMVTPRSSRDICERERARIKHVYKIIRYEFWIECTCGFKGHSLNHACPKCEAEIPFVDDSVSGAFRFL